jgi:hypothetical protein
MKPHLLLFGLGAPEVILISTTLVFLFLGAFAIVCQWRIISKCGEAGWSCLIPFYNIYILCKIVKKPELFKYWLLLIGVLFIGAMLSSISPEIGAMLLVVGGIALLAVIIIFYNALSTAFGQGAGFTVGLILLSVVFMAILAFGNYNYVLNNENSASGDMLDA